MNSVTLQVKSHPARAQGIVLSRRNHFAFVVVGGIDVAGNDREIAFRAGRRSLAYSNRVDLNYFSFASTLRRKSTTVASLYMIDCKPFTLSSKIENRVRGRTLCSV